CSAPETPGHRSGNQCRHLLFAQRGRQLYQWRHLAGGWRGFPGRPCLAPGQGKELRAVEWLSPGGNAEGDSGVGEGIEIDTNTWVERGTNHSPIHKGGLGGGSAGTSATSESPGQPDEIPLIPPLTKGEVKTDPACFRPSGIAEQQVHE